MGYRSEVRYLIMFYDKEVYDEFKVKVALDPTFNEIRNEFDVDDEKCLITFHSDWSKWYDSYPDVQAHQKLLEMADEFVELYPESIDWKFCRIGEEIDDIDIQSGGGMGFINDYLHVSVAIDYDSQNIRSGIELKENYEREKAQQEVSSNSG
jgi:hypothetical protein